MSEPDGATLACGTSASVIAEIVRAETHDNSELWKVLLRIDCHGVRWGEEFGPFKSVARAHHEAHRLINVVKGKTKGASAA